MSQKLTDAELLKKLRKSKNWSQAKAAEELRYSHVMRVSDIERGKENFSGGARRLAEILLKGKIT